MLRNTQDVNQGEIRNGNLQQLIVHLYENMFFCSFKFGWIDPLILNAGVLLVLLNVAGEFQVAISGFYKTATVYNIFWNETFQLLQPATTPILPLTAIKATNLTEAPVQYRLFHKALLWKCHHSEHVCLSVCNWQRRRQTKKKQKPQRHKEEMKERQRV